MELIQHKNKWYIKSQIGYNEVLATTDKSLGSIILKKDGLLARLQQEGRINSFLPQPSQSFVEAFVKAGGIDKVLVEYEVKYFERHSLDDGFKGAWNQIPFKNFNYSITNPESLHHKWKEYNKEVKLKTDSHNTITIKPVKNSWSREELTQLLLNYSKEQFRTMKDSKYVLDWIKENL